MLRIVVQCIWINRIILRFQPPFSIPPCRVAGYKCTGRVSSGVMSVASFYERKRAGALATEKMNWGDCNGVIFVRQKKYIHP